MIAMLFEVWPKAEHRQDYLARAAELRSLVEGIEGFVSIERFESLYEPGKLLSLGFFKDEAALAAWRNNAEHRVAQELGREHYFLDYRLRIAHVERDYGKQDRAQAPDDSRKAHGR